MDVESGTPNYKAAVYASNYVPDDIGGWTKLSQTVTASTAQTFKLRTNGRHYRNYLLWISELPPGGRVTVKALALKQ
jgi:hypothetical protein